jgi:prephenate dehydratase
LDLAASTDDAKVKNALEELRKLGNEVRVLGCYVAAQTPGVNGAG